MDGVGPRHSTSVQCYRAKLEEQVRLRALSRRDVSPPVAKHFPLADGDTAANSKANEYSPNTKKTLSSPHELS